MLYKWLYIWNYWYILDHTEVIGTKQAVGKTAWMLSPDQSITYRYQVDSPTKPERKGN